MDLTKEILGILLKKKYNRSNPFLEEEIFNIIAQAVSKEHPIRLVGFWGAGPKNKADLIDQESCDLLNTLNSEIKKNYKPGIEFTFILANMHASHNGYDSSDVNSYLDEIKNIFHNFDFKYLKLDELWRKYNITFEKIESIYETMPSDWWNEISSREIIEKNALNRNKKYSPQIAAQKYYIMRQLEKEMLENEFQGYIFHAFSSPKLHEVLPNMPTIYFWGTKKWHSDAPWFKIEN